MAATGPDGPTYFAAAEVWAKAGPFESAPRIPYWPAGYPAFLAVFLGAGLDVRVAVAAQVVVVGLGTYSLYRLVDRELGSTTVALVAVVFLSLNPMFGMASVTLMYETLLGASMVIALDLASQASHAGSKWSSLGGGGILGLGVTLQPKAALIIPAAVALMARQSRRALSLLAVFAIGAVVAPAALMARNHAVEGDAVLSTNFDRTFAIGYGDDATGTYQESLPGTCQRPNQNQEVDFVGCSLDWARENPSRLMILAAKKAYYFWAPMVAFGEDRGTWVFDLRRAVPGASPLLVRATDVLGYAWTAFLVAAVVGGAVVGLRRERTRFGTIVVLTPVLMFLAVSVLTLGDPRFRLAVSPFTAVLVALCTTQVLHRRLSVPHDID